MKQWILDAMLVLAVVLVVGGVCSAQDTPTPDATDQAQAQALQGEAEKVDLLKQVVAAKEDAFKLRVALFIEHLRAKQHASAEATFNPSTLTFAEPAK